MESYGLLIILPAAFLLDLILGDPLFLPHPIRWMGKAIELQENLKKSCFFRDFFCNISYIKRLGNYLYCCRNCRKTTSHTWNC